VILLDTHVLVWLALNPRRLSNNASAAIENARNRGVICIADITLWEIALLAQRERIRITGTIDSFLYEISLPVVVKPVTAAIAGMTVQFPDTYSRDPADRLIGATSKVEGLPLVTADTELRRSSLLETIW
jgi:PIN domain nuclease of toxin-antitoxin system